MDLGSNNLTSLPVDIFKSNTALRYLSIFIQFISTLSFPSFLNSNEFTSIPADVFNGLNSLSELKLAMSPHLNTISQCTSIQIHWNRSSQQSSQSSEIFKHFIFPLHSHSFPSFLSLIYVGYNRITSLPSDIFNKNTNLQILSVFIPFLFFTLSFTSLPQQQQFVLRTRWNLLQTHQS